MKHFDLLTVWKEESFRLELFDFWPQNDGRQRLAYRFLDGGELIFRGSDFGPSPLHVIDSKETIASLLSFLSLCPGDTDSEYFQDYTQRQLEWAEKNGEYLSLLVYDIENGEEEIE